MISDELARKFLPEANRAIILAREADTMADTVAYVELLNGRGAARRKAGRRIPPTVFWRRPAVIEMVAAEIDDSSAAMPEETVSLHASKYLAVDRSTSTISAHFLLPSRKWASAVIANHLEMIRWTAAPEEFNYQNKGMPPTEQPDGVIVRPYGWGLMYRIAPRAIVIARRDGLDTWTSWSSPPRLSGHKSAVEIRGQSIGMLVAMGAPVHAWTSSARRWLRLIAPLIEEAQ